MTTPRLMLAVFAVTTLSACLPANPGSELADRLPDDRLLINMPVDDGAKDEREWSEAYLFTSQVTRDVNNMTGFVLVLVDTITDFPATYVDGDNNHATWGPWSDALDPVETALTVQLQDDGSTTWQFQQKPKGADDSEYVPVIAGEVDADSAEGTGSGRFAIDYDALNELDPNQSATGAYAVEYEVDESGVRGQAAFQNFSDNGGEVFDALYRYDQVHGGQGEMDLGWTTDGEDLGSELVWIVRSRWTEIGEGRSDSLVTGGELGESFATASECWDNSFAPVYMQNSWEGVLDGEEEACSFSDAEYPAE
ncbi:MAG: hypothetical protein ACI9VR_000656 [Cognaticolwellia sp.]|jgi:hypothetical protein